MKPFFHHLSDIPIENEDGITTADNSGSINPTFIPPTLRTSTTVNPFTPARITTTTTAIPITTTATLTPTTTTTTVAGGDGPPLSPPDPTTTTTILPPVNPSPDQGPPGSSEGGENENNSGPPGSSKDEKTTKPTTEDKTKPPAEEVVKPPAEEAKPVTEETKPPAEETPKPAEETSKPPTEEEAKKPGTDEAPKAPTEGGSEPASSSGPPGSESGTAPSVGGGGGGGGPPGSKRVHDTPPASAAEEKLLTDAANEQKTPKKLLHSKKKMNKKPKVKGLSQEEGDHFKVYITDDGDSKESDEESPLKIKSGSNKHFNSQSNSGGYRDLDKEQRVGNYRKFHGNSTYHSSLNIESDDKQQNDVFGKPMHTLQKYIEESTKEEMEEKGLPLVPSKKHHDVFDEENTLQEQERIYKGETTSAELAATSTSNNMADQETEIENIYKTMHKQEHKFDRKVLAEPKAPRVETEEEKVFSSSMRQKDKPKEVPEDANTKESPLQDEDINIKESPDKNAHKESSKGNAVDANKKPLSGGDGHRKSADDVFDMPDEIPAESSLDSYEKHIMRDKHGRTKPTGRADSKDDIVELLKQYGKLKEEVTELTKESADAVLPIIEYNGRRKSERSRSPTSAKLRSKSTRSRHNN